jgi:beta-lactam-binding protein with PASTA domain
MQLNLFKRYNTSTLGGLLIHILIATFWLLTLLVIYFFAYLPSTTNHGETITVPSIEGQTIEEAAETLAKHDLRSEVSDSSYSSEVPPLTVLKQYPHANAKVKEGRKIYLTVNRVNPPSVPLPNLIDNSLVNAEALLKANELKRGRISYVHGPFMQLVKEMRYKGLKIEPKTLVPKGAIIELVIEDGGSQNTPAFDLVDMPFDEAKFLLISYSLNLGRVVLVGDTTTGSAVVIKQHPKAGEPLMVGDIVDIWIGELGTEPPSDENEP